MSVPRLLEVTRIPASMELRQVSHWTKGAKGTSMDGMDG